MVRAARRRPTVLVIGLDADPTRMRRASAQAPGNTRFVVAAAEGLPAELDRAVSELSIYFPWGSLLHSLVGAVVAPSPGILEGIARMVRPGGTLTALLSITERDGGTALCPPSIAVAAYAGCGLGVTEWRPARPPEVVASDSSWAKRLRAGERRPVWKLGARRLGDS